jgi:hypothetical protein
MATTTLTPDPNPITAAVIEFEDGPGRRLSTLSVCNRKLQPAIAESLTGKPSAGTEQTPQQVVACVSKEACAADAKRIGHLVCGQQRGQQRGALRGPCGGCLTGYWRRMQHPLHGHPPLPRGRLEPD